MSGILGMNKQLSFEFIKLFAVHNRRNGWQGEEEKYHLLYGNGDSFNGPEYFRSASAAIEYAAKYGFTAINLGRVFTGKDYQENR